MTSMLVSLPDSLATRFKSAVPARSRSKFLAELLEREISKREQALYRTAVAVENDTALNADMAAWETTVGDGLDDAR